MSEFRQIQIEGMGQNSPIMNSMENSNREKGADLQVEGNTEYLKDAEHLAKRQKYIVQEPQIMANERSKTTGTVDPR